MTKPSIQIPLTLAMEAFSAVFEHASKDDVSPIITGVCIRGGSVYATDRYSVGSFLLGIEPSDGDIILPRDAAAWIARTVVKNLPSHAFNRADDMTVNITSAVRDEAKEPGSMRDIGVDRLIVVELVSERFGVEARRMFWPIYGNYPPIWRLLDEFQPGDSVTTVALRPVLIERFTKYARTWHRESPINMTLGKGSNPAKPGVVRFEIGSFTGLLQPNLMLR